MQSRLFLERNGDKKNKKIKSGSNPVTLTLWAESGRRFCGVCMRRSCWRSPAPWRRLSRNYRSYLSGWTPRASWSLKHNTSQVLRIWLRNSGQILRTAVISVFVTVSSKRPPTSCLSCHVCTHQVKWTHSGKSRDTLWNKTEFSNSDQNLKQFPVCFCCRSKFCKLTWCCGLTNEGNQIFFDGVEGIKVVHNEDVPLAGFAADLLQLHEIHIGNTDRKDAVAWRHRNTVRT